MIRVIMCAYVVLGFCALNVRSAIYVWNGSAADGKWETAKNWTVRGAKHTWPNSQRGRLINKDCERIVIDNGDEVRYSGLALCIDGTSDGSITSALIIDNASTLIGQSIYLGDGVGRKGQIGIRDGATLIVQGKLDVGNDGYGGLFVSSGKLIVKETLGIGSGKYASGEAIVCGESIITVDKDIILSDFYSAKSQLTINGGMITVKGTVYLGGKYAAEEALCRIFLKGGVLKCGNLIFNEKLSKIICTGGKLMVNAKNLSKADMEKLIASGRIDVSEAKSWKIITVDKYIALVTE